MKLGFQIVLFAICLNLTCSLVYALAIPGTQYSFSFTGTAGNATDIKNRFNPDAEANATNPSVIAEFPFLGNVYGSFMLFWNAVSFIVLGFPTLLQSFAGAIQDPTARAGYMDIIYVLDAIIAVIYFTWIFQLISGRQVQD